MNNYALEAKALTKLYGHRRGLTNCDLQIPVGHVVGLVGPNGAGKSTLLNMAVGLVQPTSGVIEVLGAKPASDSNQLAKVGYVAQSLPVFAKLSVADHLEFGRRTNKVWDNDFAKRRLAEVGLDPNQKAGKLSGGQRAQLCLTLALAKYPDLLVLDEPFASLDPLARSQLLKTLMAYVARPDSIAASGNAPSIILSTHLVSDLERVCDYIVVLTDSQVRLAGELDDIMASHYRVTGARDSVSPLPGWSIIQTQHYGNQSDYLIRSSAPIEATSQTVSALSLEDIVLGYLESYSDSAINTQEE